jgi:hypothetical protein
MTEIREDLLRGLLQSCYVIEHARAGVQGRWGGDFDRDASRTLQRAERLGSLLDEKGFRRTEEVVGPHTDWFESLAGSAPDEVPLGAAALHQFGKWAEVYAGPYLDGDIDDFRDLGREHARVELEVRTMNEGEAFLDPTALPQGRRFVVLTDIHVGSRGREVLLRSAIDDINALEPELEQRIAEVARKAWEHLANAEGYGRVDMRLSPEGQPYVLEVNPTPDLSSNAGLARMGRAFGWSYDDLVMQIVDEALMRSQSHRAAAVLVSGVTAA